MSRDVNVDVNIMSQMSSDLTLEGKRDVTEMCHGDATRDVTGHRTATGLCWRASTQKKTIGGGRRACALRARAGNLVARRPLLLFA